MTKLQLIEQIQKLRRPGDPLIPGDKKLMEERLAQLQKRQQELLRG